MHLFSMQMYTDQCVDECVFVTELCLEECVLLAELLHLVSKLCDLLCLKAVDLGGVTLAASLTLAILTWSTMQSHTDRCFIWVHKSH